MLLLLPSSAEYLEMLGALTIQAGEQLCAVIHDPEIDIEDTPPETPRDSLFVLAQFGRQLYEVNKGDEQITKASVSHALTQAVAEYKFKLPSLEQTTDILFSIVRPTDELRFKKKIARVQGGLGNDFVALNSLVELRPVFDDAFVSKKWVVATTIRILYYDGSDKALTLELDQEGLDNLRKAVERIDKKIAATEKCAVEKGLIL